jgi:hypothetical protein
MVVAVLAILVAAVVTLGLSLTVASGALAANHAQPGTGYQGMRHIVVEQGQTLWSIAVAAEPASDPRLVIQQIMEVNSMTGSTVRAGQMMWVPGR